MNKSMGKILVTGGLGYIGSHVVVELQKMKFEVIIIDDLSNSSLNVLDGITKITGVKANFEEIDLNKETDVEKFFKQHSDIEGVIHLAGSKLVHESIKNPLKYYGNNIHPLVNILKGLNTLASRKLIFSSSCTVYGEAKTVPITEDSTIKNAASPYGKTKIFCEKIIEDCCIANPSLNAISLRYFNPIGAHSSANIGELPIGLPQNLVPFITQTAIGIREELSIFGNDYTTPDGTCVRDYIHVVDLARAHVFAIKRLLEKKNLSSPEVFNIGTGKGASVLEVVKAFEEVSGVKLNYVFKERRPGDVVCAFADTSKAKKILGWKSELCLKDALVSAWDWEKKLNLNKKII